MMALVQNVAPELAISARDTGWGFASAHQDSKKTARSEILLKIFLPNEPWFHATSVAIARRGSSRSCGVDLFPAFPGWSAPPARAAPGQLTAERQVSTTT